MTITTELAQRLREPAEKATQGEWSAQGTSVFSEEFDEIAMLETIHPLADIANSEFIALANPANVLALLDALEAKSAEAALRGQEAQTLSDALKISRQRIAELEASHAQVINARDHYKRISEEGLQRVAEARTEQHSVTDAMALAFHAALSDGSIGSDDVEEIKTGLRAVFANYTAPPAPAPVTVKLPREIEPDAVTYIIDPTANPDEYACCVGADMWNKAIRACVRNLRAAGIKIAEGE